MKKIKIILLLLVAWFLIHELFIISDGLLSQPTQSDYAVVFGNRVNPDGSLSERLEARMHKALELYNDSLVAKIFVSGGLGKEGHYEAQKMAEYLLAHQVKAADIVIDDQGNNTWLSALNFKNSYPDSTSVVLVSQYFHISRCKLSFKKLGFTRISAVSPNYFEWRDFYALFREFFGYYKYCFFY